MSASASSRPPRAPRRQAQSFAESLEQTLSALGDKGRARLSAGLTAGGALASLVGIALVPGCDPAVPGEAGATGSITSPVIAYGQRDWAQQLGTRDRSKVTYYNEFWRDYSSCSSRYGCSSLTVFIKVRVKPTVGADLSYKKIGVVYRELGKSDPITVTGYYFATHGDGWEEWHVPVKSTSFQGAFTFNAWYEDGKSGRFYDDNNGELYALTWTDPPKDYVTVRPDWALSTATVSATGVSGRLAFVIADLDYDKELRLEWSTDNWTTTNVAPMGTAGEKNKLIWNANLGNDFERWVIDLDLPGSPLNFRCRLVYKHGVVNGATPVEFVGGGPSGYFLEKK